MVTTQMPSPDAPFRSSAKGANAAVRSLLAARGAQELWQVVSSELNQLGFESVAVLRIRYRPFRADLVCCHDFEEDWLARLKERFGSAPCGLFEALQPELTTVSGIPGTLGAYPVVFRDTEPCAEAQRLAPLGCLALQNSSSADAKGEKHCDVCGITSYLYVVIVRLPEGAEREAVGKASELIELAGICLTNVAKAENADRRLSELDIMVGQMQTVMEGMSDPAVLTDIHCRVIMQNRAAQKFFRAADGGGAQVRCAQLNRKLFTTAVQDMVVGTERVRDLLLVDPATDREVRFEAASTVTFARDGRRTGMVTVMRDVTELRHASEELKTNYERLRASEELVRQDRDRLNLIIENVGEPIVVCDPRGNIVLLDPLAQDLLGNYEESVAVDRNAAKFRSYITKFTESAAERETTVLKLRNASTRQDIDYDVHSGKVFDGNGDVAYTVTVLRDLTSVRRVEQLKLERRMLEMEKFAVAGRLAGTIAHEVNNPLEAIKNCIYLLSNSVDPQAQPVYEILRSETERVARIVRQMLGLYRNNQQVGPVDVNAVVEDTLLLFSRQLERSGVRVKPRLGQLPKSVGSSDQLRQVLSNLIVNAKDSMAGGGTLNIRTRHARFFERDCIRILVADTGCGIPSQLLSTLFQPFVTTKGERGTGLGLWIVKGIVENHGGRLKVKSKVGKGTVFQMEFPVVA